MPRIGTILFTLLFLAAPSRAAENDPCSETSSVSDVQFSVAVENNQAVFQAGEIIPLVMSFTSSAKNRYWADVRNYDRSGRLGIEYYCVVPEAADPLESYFKVGVFMGGGLGTDRALDATPFVAEAQLNEWRRLGAGHYRVYVVSFRVWRPPDPNEKTPYGQVSEVVRSNTVELDVLPAGAEWQSDQVRSATQTLASPLTDDSASIAARKLRFLNTPDSTKQLARFFSGLNRQPYEWDLMFGLYGSSYRQLAIDSMRNELAAPEHAITEEFLRVLVDLQVSADKSWDLPAADPAHPETGQEFWQRRQAHARELEQLEMQKVLAALPRKSGKARAVTLHGLLTAGGDDPAFVQSMRPALIASWEDLPAETQRELIQSRWSLIAGPEMLPILRRIVAEPASPIRTDQAMARDAALKHIYEFDPAAGRALILRDLQNVNLQPSLEVVKLLQPEEAVIALQPALARIGLNDARELDYVLLDRYADAGALGQVQTVFEANLGKWACVPQSAMLRYFLRVAPEYGVREVNASLKTRKDTHCFSSLFQELGDELPRAQKSAIDSLDDPDTEVVGDAAGALRKWGSADAEAPLWARLKRFHEEWAEREGQLRVTPDYRSPASRGTALEQILVSAIAGGRNWICPPEKLASLAQLVWTYGQRQQIDGWINQWKQGSALVNPVWYPEDNPTFSVLQYDSLTESQLSAKLAQFPSGTELLWQFWPPGQISPPVSMAKQEAFYERMRAVAEQHRITLGKANYQ